MVVIQCPKCRSKKVYLMGTGKRRCARCRYDFTPHRPPLYLTREQWKEIIRCTGIASQGFVHLLVNHGEKQYSDGKGNHINGLEGFRDT
jgi:hypothetical protein